MPPRSRMEKQRLPSALGCSSLCLAFLCRHLWLSFSHKESAKSLCIHCTTKCHAYTTSRHDDVSVDSCPRGRWLKDENSSVSQTSSPSTHNPVFLSPICFPSDASRSWEAVVLRETTTHIQGHSQSWTATPTSAGESRGKRCLYETSKVTASDINSTLQEPWPNQISLFSLILSLTSKETVKTRIPTGCAPMIPLKKKKKLRLTTRSFLVCFSLWSPDNGAQLCNVRWTNTCVSLAKNPSSRVLSCACFSRTSSLLCLLQWNVPSWVCLSLSPVSTSGQQSFLHNTPVPQHNWLQEPLHLLFTPPYA